MESASTTPKTSLASLFYTTSLIFYGLGLYFPILSSRTSILGITIEKKSLRLIDSVEYFYENNDLFLALVILIFTIVFPLLKYVDLALRLFSPKALPQRLVQTLSNLDKWSMIDVFLVALLILNFKLTTSFISMELKLGTTFIALSVVFRMLASHFIEKRYVNIVS